jgi:hypothetical protein
VRHDIRGEKLEELGVVPSIAMNQQIDPSVLVLPDQIDGLGHGAGKTRRRSARKQPLAIRRYLGRVTGKQPRLDMRLFDRVVVAIRRVAMPAQHGQLVPDLCDVAADEIAGVGQSSDRT